MPSNMQIDLFTNYTCLLIALSYTILIYISRVFLKEVIENKITSSSIFLQYLSESSCTPWNFQPGWAEDQNPWEVFFKSLLSRAQLGTLNQDFWGRDPGKDILKKFPWWFPCTLWLRQDLKIRGLKKLWLVVKHLPWVANWEMYSLIKYLNYHRPQKTLSPSLSSFSSSVSVLFLHFLV